MKENKQALYFNMILGTIGTVLILLAAMRYRIKEHNEIGYINIFFGFLLTISYINYLEKRAGISKKLTWIRVIISLIYFFPFHISYSSNGRNPLTRIRAIFTFPFDEASIFRDDSKQYVSIQFKKL